MNATRRIVSAVVAFALMTLVAGINHTSAASARTRVDVVHIAVINDSTVSALRTAFEQKPALVVLEIDSGGGTETALNSMLNLVASAKTPSAAQVSDGAEAYNGALILAESTDFFSASDTAQIGSPHGMKASRNPGTLGSNLASLKGRDSVWVYRALTAGLQMRGAQAIQQQITDADASNTAALIASLNGKNVSGHRIPTAGAIVTSVPPTGWDAVINALATPDAAFLLLMITLSFFILWAVHPGNIVVMAGAVVSAVLAALSFSDLPVEPTGIVLALAASVVLVADLFNSTHGILTAVGATLMVLGGWLLVDTSAMADGVSVLLIAVTVLSVTGGYAYLAPRLLAVRRMPVANQWIGRRATVTEDLEPDGMVRLQGALWRATSESGVATAGESVEVTDVKGLKLTVRKPSGR